MHEIGVILDLGHSLMSGVMMCVLFVYLWREKNPPPSLILFALILAL